VDVVASGDGLSNTEFEFSRLTFTSSSFRQDLPIPIHNDNLANGVNTLVLTLRSPTLSCSNPPTSDAPPSEPALAVGLPAQVGSGCFVFGPGDEFTSELSLATSEPATIVIFQVERTIAIVSPPGGLATGTAGQTLPDPLVVVVRENGSPVDEAPVTWSATTGGTVLPTSPTTDSEGRASAQLTLSLTAPPEVTVTALSPGATGEAVFTITLTPPPDRHVFIVSGNNQTGVPNAPLPAPLVVSVSPATPPVDVQWQVVSGAGTLANPVTQTNPSGEASNTFTLGANGAAVTISASVGSSSVSFDVATPTELATKALEQYATLANLAVLVTTVQTHNIGIRLSALRRGATGVSLSGLSLNVDGQSVPLGSVTALLLGPGGGGASADNSLLKRLGVFVNGQGSFGDQDTTSGETGFDFHTAGLTVGTDYRVTDNLVLGGAFGYLTTKQTFAANSGEFSTKGYSISTYGSFFLTEKFFVDGIATFGWNDYDTARNVPIDTTTATAKADTDGTQFALSVSTGYSLDFGALSVGPTLRVDYIHVHIDSIQEQGAGIYDMNVNSQNLNSVTTALGARLSYVISTPVGVFVPMVRAEWQHEYSGDSRLVTGSFVADPLATPFSVSTNNPDRDYANLGAAISGQFKHGVSAFLNFDTQLGWSNITNYSFNGGVRFEF
jgi:outer membrane autotransporter protein